MIYRRLDNNGDYVMGHGQADYLVNSPECVAQAVITRLRLLAGEWFLDLTEGMPYQTHVFGKHVPTTYNPLIRARILATEGVKELLFFESLYDSETRRLTVNTRISTVYGDVNVREVV